MAAAEQTSKGEAMILTPLEDVETPPPPGEEAPKWHLVADKLTTFSDNSIVEAEGGVVLTRGNDVLKADFARYYSETDWIYLKGNVFVRMGRDDINAREAEFDLRSKTGWLTDGDIFMEGQHTYFKGERIIKHYGDRYTFRQAKVTTCDGDTPAWAVTADEAVVEIDGYAQLFRSSFLVKDVGVMYSPFMILPAKTSRQSGFLAPDYGVSNKRGLYYTQPYYWAINDTSDVTFYGGFMTKRGPLMGVEYRSHPFTGQKTWLAASGIHDSKTVKNPGENDVYDNSLLRTNRERFWLRGMADGFIGNTGWRYRSDIDFVSDQNYLREFSNGPMGFRRSRNQLFEMFGRDLREDDQNRQSKAIVYRDWERLGLAASVSYQQNPALGHGNLPRSRDTLVQELPRLDAFLYKGFVFPGFSFLEAEAQFSTGYMHRQYGTSGIRSELYPVVSVPLDLGFVSIIASGGVRQTWYSNTTTSDNSPITGSLASGGSPRQTSEARTIPQFSINAFTEASRVWKLDDELTVKDPIGSSAWVGVRHQIQPRVRYSYVSHVDQERNPFYFADDRILPTNELVYSVTNIVTRKRAIVTPGEPSVSATPAAAGQNSPQADPAAQTAMPILAFDYLDLIRWRIETGYDFNEARRTKYRDEFKRRPFMDILSDLDLRVSDWWGYSGKFYISPYNGSVTRQDHGAYFTWAGRLNWSVGVSQRSKDYDYRRRLRYENRNNVALAQPVRLLYNTLAFNVSPEWSIFVTDHRNMREGGKFGRAYEQSISVAYTAQCYRFVGEYRRDNYEKSYSFMVELPGLFD